MRFCTYIRTVMFCALMLIVGCATSDKYNQKLNSLIGQTTTQLQQEMGKPSAKQIFGDNSEIWAYTKIDDTYVPSEFYLYDQGALSNEYHGLYAPFMSQYDFSPYEQGFGYNVTYYCQTAFLINNNIVVGWKWHGNNCTVD